MFLEYYQKLVGNYRTESWLKPKVYHEIFKDNLIAIDERFKVFNCGIGMAIIIDKKDLK